MAENPLRPIAEIVSGPEDVLAAIEELRRRLIDAAGEHLDGLVLTGSLARGRYRPYYSDVNLIVVLGDTSCKTLDALTPALRSAWRQVRVEPMIVKSDEVRRLADVFPVKVLDVQKHHVTLYGENPFEGVEIDDEHLRLRTEQQLRNLLLRLRRRYLEMPGDTHAMLKRLSDAACSLAIDLGTMLRLSNHELPTDDSPQEILQAAARAFELDGETLGRIAALRDGDAAVDAPEELYDAVLRIIEQVTQIADRMETSA